MLKLKKLLFSIFLILNLICISVFAITTSEFKTSFESWASGKSFGSFVLNSSLKASVENYIDNNFPDYNYFYCGCGHNNNTGSTYVLVCLSNDGAQISSFTTAPNNFTIKFNKNIEAHTYIVNDFDYSISTTTSGTNGSINSIGLYTSNAYMSWYTLQSDGTLDNTFYNYAIFLEDYVPPNPPEPVVPDFSIALLLSSVSSGISDFSTFLNIIFADNFFVSIVLILISIFIILLAVRIIKKFMRRKDEKIF